MRYNTATELRGDKRMAGKTNWFLKSTNKRGGRQASRLQIKPHPTAILMSPQHNCLLTVGSIIDLTSLHIFME